MSVQNGSSRFIWFWIVLSVVVTFVLDYFTGTIEPAGLRWIKNLVHANASFMAGLLVHSVIDRFYDMPRVSAMDLQSMKGITPTVAAAMISTSNPYLFAAMFALVVALI